MKLPTHKQTEEHEYAVVSHNVEFKEKSISLRVLWACACGEFYETVSVKSLNDVRVNVE